jgi:hypothetical protein
MLRHATFQILNLLGKLTSAFATDNVVYVQIKKNWNIHKKTYPQNTSTSYTSIYIINLKTGFIDIKGPDYYHIRWRNKVPFGDWDLFHDILAHNINIILQLG